MTVEPPQEDLIRYDVMVQEALIGVVRKVLIDASRDGLPGEHHFYVTFRSRAPGVKLSTRLKEKYPEEMTIVIQHQFWDLAVSDTTLEVGLSFGGVPERLVIPFDALTGFYDPSVQFGLKFATDEAQADNDLLDKPAGEVSASMAERLRTISAHEENGRDQPPSRALEDLIAEAPVKKPRSKKGDAANSASAIPSPAELPRKSADVVSIDAFRKKKP